mmetsp:Transcript_26792/g.40528  ORF Transcript_26792/g.40528 Transcript_26792/m.40528 type:complete len:216 (+) Transcript_26792:238-885(+)
MVIKKFRPPLVGEARVVVVSSSVRLWWWFQIPSRLRLRRRRCRCGQVPSFLVMGTIQDTHITAHHGRQRFESRCIQYRGGQINIQCQIVIGSTHHGGVHPRIFNNQWHLDTFLMGIPFVRQSMFGVKVAIVGRKDNESFVVNSVSFQCFQQLSHGSIHFGGHAIIIFHHGLVFVGFVVAPSITRTSLVVISKKVWHFLPCFRSGGRWYRDGGIGI